MVTLISGSSIEFVCYKLEQHEIDGFLKVHLVLSYRSGEEWTESTPLITKRRADYLRSSIAVEYTK